MTPEELWFLHHTSKNRNDSFVTKDLMDKGLLKRTLCYDVFSFSLTEKGEQVLGRALKLLSTVD